VYLNSLGHHKGTASTFNFQLLTLPMAVALPTLPTHRYSVLHRWHLLSLDAPTVAVVWTLAAARITHHTLSWYVPGAMFVAVWLVYVADRLLDYKQGEELEARHRFHGRFRRRFVIAAMIALPALLALMWKMPARALLAYILLCAPLVLYFAAIHKTRFRQKAPKEAVVGIFFAAAVFLPEFFTPRVAIATTFFALLCWLNCVAIYRWENPQSSDWSARNFRPLVLILAAVCALTPFSPAPHPFAILNLCTASSALLLLALDCTRRPISSVTLRAAADAALLTPLVLFFLR